MTYKIYTFCEILTVVNCKDKKEAIKKTGLSEDVILKIEKA